MNKEEIKSRILAQFKDEKSPIKYALYKSDCRVSANESLCCKTNYLLCANANLLVIVDVIPKELSGESFQVKFLDISSGPLTTMGIQPNLAKDNVWDIESDTFRRYFFAESIVCKGDEIIFSMNDFVLSVDDYQFDKWDGPEPNQCVFNVKSMKFNDIEKVMSTIRYSEHLIKNLSNHSTHIEYQFDIPTYVQFINYLTSHGLDKKDYDAIMAAFMAVINHDSAVTSLPRILRKLLELHPSDSRKEE